MTDSAYKILVYGAGVLGTVYAARLHERGHHVALLARGARLAALREHGVLLAEVGGTSIRRSEVPVVDSPAGDYDLTLVLVRSHQVPDVLESLADGTGDVLFLLNWAAGPDPLTALLGNRVLLGFPTFGGGVMEGDVARYRGPSPLDRLIAMPIGEPDGRPSARVERVVRMFRTAGIGAKHQPQMDAWLKTHAAFEVPLGLAVKAAGGPAALAENRDGVLEMVRGIRESLGSLEGRPVPRAFGALRAIPELMLVPVFRAFLRGPAAAPLNTVTPAAFGELDLLAEQLRR